MEYLIGGAGLLIAIIALIYQVKGNKRVPSFKGQLGKTCDSKTMARFAAFIFERLGKVVKLDIHFLDEDNYTFRPGEALYFFFYEDDSKLINYQLSVEY